MSEIRFSCPHCGQHIACPRDYVEMVVVCPTCAKPMEVPNLGNGNGPHPDLCVVASVPTPRPRFSSRIPTINLWTEKEWDQRYEAVTAPPQHTPAWLLAGLATLIIAALLKAAHMPAWLIIASVAAGTAVSGWLLFTRRTVGVAAPGGGSLATTVGYSIAFILFILVAIPAIALGVLFVGCATGCG